MGKQIELQEFRFESNRKNDNPIHATISGFRIKENSHTK